MKNKTLLLCYWVTESVSAERKNEQNWAGNNFCVSGSCLPGSSSMWDLRRWTEAVGSDTPRHCHHLQDVCVRQQGPSRTPFPGIQAALEKLNMDL